MDRNIGLTLDEGSRVVGERRYRRRDGSLVDVLACGSAVSYGRRWGMSLVVRYITGRKRYEAVGEGTGPLQRRAGS